MFLTPLLLIAIIVGVGFAIQQRRKSSSTKDAFAPPKPPRRIPAVAEALGYLGGILGVVGLVLLIASYWEDMASAIKVSVTAGAALLFIVGGYLVPEKVDETFTRLKWFLWFAATAAATTSGGVVANEYITSDDGTRIVIGASLACAVVSAVLWAWRERPLQHVTTLAGTVVLLGASVAQFTDLGPVGLAVFGLSVTFVMVGLAQLSPLPAVTVFVGSVGVVVGPMIMSGEWRGPGLFLASFSALSLIAMGMTKRFVHDRDSYVVLSTVGFLGFFQATGVMTIAHFASEAGILTGLVVSLIGALTIIACDRGALRQRLAMTCLGALASVVGIAVTGAQSFSFATIVGLIVSVTLIGIGALPEHAVLSIFGSIGLLIFVPWFIGHFFPGDVSAPLLLFISGLLIVAIAVLLSRMGGRFKREFASTR